MNCLKLRKLVSLFAAAAGSVVLAACLTMAAQQTTTDAVTPPATKPAPRVPATKTAKLKPAAKAQPAGTVAVPASSQTVMTPATAGTAATVSNAASGVAATSANTMNNMAGTPASAPSGTTPGAGMSSAPAPAGDTRAPVAGQGVGTFVTGGWTLTAYGCFRTGTRLFCDFDVVFRRNMQANSSIWRQVNLVDDGGKITGRHNAFFVGDDGSQFPTAYIAPPTPARFIIEYDNIDARYTSIALVAGPQRIPGVPVTAMDASQPAGTIPVRRR